MRRQEEQQAGQVLAQVALMMVVLLGFLALAVDVGQVYFKRRQLQNAADAGALEGARQICFVPGATTASAEAAAHDEAVANAPGADARPSLSGWQMTVVVTDSIPSFAASILGIGEFGPGASAKAVCGSADRGVGNLWPVTMRITDWTNFQCGKIFTVWRGDNNIINCTQCDCSRVFAAGNGQSQIYFPTQALYDELTTVGALMSIGPGQDGWLNLPDPSAPMPLPTCNYSNCGAQGVACYISQPHPGPISVCDQVGNKSGSNFDENGKSAVRDHANLETRLSIPLWNNDAAFLANCPSITPVIGNCGTSSPYTVADFGCIEILGYSTKAFVKNLPGSTASCDRDNLEVIFARKLCGGQCNSFQGGTGGGAFQGVRAVSLIE